MPPQAEGGDGAPDRKVRPLSERLRSPVQLERHELPPPDELHAAIGRIRERWPDLPSLPAEADRERILGRFAWRVENDRWEDCTLAEAARALRIACLPEFRQPIYSKALHCLLDEVSKQRRPLLVSAALSAYLDTWEAGNRYTQDLALRLSQLVSSDFPPRWRTLVAACPELFDAAAAHRAFAGRMAASGDPWGDLRALGVPDPHGPGLWAAAQAEWLERIAPTLTTEDGIRRLLRWLRPDRARAPLPAARATAPIEALVCAWRGRMPPQALADLITGRLTELYGDPRRFMGAPWGGMDRALLDAYRSWLTGANLRLFLDVITLAEERFTRADERHMWEPRRKFWIRLFEQGRIREAWPAFSEEASAIARDLLDRRHLRLDHGRQIGRSNNTSILIMRVAGARAEWIVVEGSHSYKVQIFDAKAAGVPKLYQPHYDCDIIRRQPKRAAIVHRPDTWQFKVMRMLDT